MSSIYLYIIYISRPWFKGSGAALHGGRSENGGRWQVADPYQTSILLCPFCRYAIVHTNHHFARKRESTAMAILLTFFFNWWKNGCVPKDFNQKHAGCRETSGVFCCERGSGFRVQGSGFRVQGCGGGFAANIYGAMPEGLLIAGFPRIVSLPLEGKVPRRGG